MGLRTQDMGGRPPRPGNCVRSAVHAQLGGDERPSVDTNRSDCSEDRSRKPGQPQWGYVPARFSIRGLDELADRSGLGSPATSDVRAEFRIQYFRPIGFCCPSWVNAVVNKPQSNLANLKISAEREIGAFIKVVTDSLGVAEARLAAAEWLEELESADLTPDLHLLDLRAITIAAATRLAVRLSTTSSDTKVSPILSSNCLAPRDLA
jgi:hypothetical protein